MFVLNALAKTLAPLGPISFLSRANTLSVLFVVSAAPSDSRAIVAHLIPAQINLLERRILLQRHRVLAKPCAFIPLVRSLSARSVLLFARPSPTAFAPSTPNLSRLRSSSSASNSDSSRVTVLQSSALIAAIAPPLSKSSTPKSEEGGKEVGHGVENEFGGGVGVLWPSRRLW